MRKKTIQCILLFAGLSLSTVSAEPVRVSPAVPLQGSPVTITYRPDSDSSRLTDPVQPVVYALLWGVQGDPVFASYPLVPGRDGWMATFTPTPGVLAVQYKIVDGADSDDKDGAHWDFLLHHADGKVLPGGYVALGRSLIFEKRLPNHIAQAEMVRSLDAPRSITCFKKELERDPDYPMASYYYVLGLRWAMDQAEDRRAAIAGALSFADQVLEAHPEDPFAMAAYAMAQQHFGSRHQAAALTRELISAHPGHPAAEEFMAWEASFPGGSASPARRIEAAEQYLRYYPDSQRPVVTDVVLPSFVALGRLKEAMEWLDDFGGRLASMYHYLGNRMRQHGPESADMAVAALERALALWNDHGGDVPRPAYVTPREWDADPYAARRHRQFLRMQMDYALALSLAGREEESLRPAALACELNNREDLQVITDHLKVLSRAGRYQEAMDVASSTVLSDMWDEDFLEEFRLVYVNINSSEEGFAAQLESLQVLAMRDRYAAQMKNEEAPDFSLEIHGGGELSLSDLKGKVVVLDFWALWCGPCMRAFPYFQQARDYYANHPDVLLLALNTMENVHGEVLRDRVQSFLEDNEYSFKVLYDYNRTAVARMYDVQGIPTRITIGRDNKLRFRDVGFSGEEMFLNMRAQIDLLLEED